MKSIFIGLLVTLVFVTNAQQNSGSDELQLEAQRTRIQGERNKAQSIFEGNEVQCYQRFAVNDCLKDARNLRRDALADLRRQELSLNSAQAKRKGADTIRRLEERSSLGEQQQEAVRLQAAQAQTQERQQAFDNRAAIRSESGQTETARLEETENRERKTAEASLARAKKALSVDSERRNYEKRQRLAEQKRISRNKEAVRRKETSRISEKSPSK